MIRVEIATAAVSVIALVISCVTYYHSNILQRRKNTIEGYVKLQDALGYLYAYRKDEIELFVDAVDDDEYKALSAQVARIEIFATGIKKKVFDFETFYDIAHGFVDKSLRRKIEYIIGLKNSDSKDTYYNNTMWLLQRMDSRSKKGDN